MKVNKFSCFAFGLLFFSLSSMEEGEHEPVQAEKISKPRKMLSLVDVVLSNYAKEAIELYDQKEKNYDLMNRFIKDKLEKINSIEIKESFINIIHEIIIREFGRIDIITNEFIRLWSETDDGLLGFNFFNKFDEDIKIAIIDWLLSNLLDYRNFDILEIREEEGVLRCVDKDTLVLLLYLIFKEPLAIASYDKILRTISSVHKEPKRYQNHKIGNEYSASPEFDKDNNLIITLTSPSGVMSAELVEKSQPILNKFRLVYRYLAGIARILVEPIQEKLRNQIEANKFKHEKTFNAELEAAKNELKELVNAYKDAHDGDRSEFKKKIKEFADRFDKIELEQLIDYLFLTDPVFVSLIVLEKQEKQYDPLELVKLIYLNDECLINEAERIFEMLLKEFPEYSEIIYYKQVSAILGWHRVAVICYLEQKLCFSTQIKLTKLIQAGNYDDAVDELYLYYARFGFLFIHDVLKSMSGERECFNKFDSETWLAILNNLGNIILKFAAKCDINIEKFDLEFELMKEKLKTFKGS